MCKEEPPSPVSLAGLNHTSPVTPQALCVPLFSHKSYLASNSHGHSIACRDGLQWEGQVRVEQDNRRRLLSWFYEDNTGCLIRKILIL